MKYFSLFLSLVLVSFLIPNFSFAQAKCQPKDCKKESTADKSTTDKDYYVKIDLQITPKSNSCSPSAEKAKTVSSKGKTVKVASKTNCDPKDCPPNCKPNCDPKDCLPASGEKIKASAKTTESTSLAKKVSLNNKKDCDPKACKPANCEEKKVEKSRSL